MAVHYRLYQNNNRKSEQYKKWYGRAVALSTVTIYDLAKDIEANCTVKQADILAVLSELVVSMKKELQNSHRVKLDGFGTFKIGLNTTGTDTAKEFSARNNVKGVHVLFLPEHRMDASGRRICTFLDGCRIAELPVNAVDKGIDAGDSTDESVEVM